MYRNLDTLEDAGLVHHVHLGHGPGRYAPAAGAHAGYAACEDCGRHVVLDPGALAIVGEAVREACGFAAGFTHFPIIGRCADCEVTDMHIPDGFLAPEVAAGTAVVAAGAVGYGLRRASSTLDDRTVPLLGVTGAFVFAAQMLNFPVAGGTSGHFLGAALAAVLLGPWLACLVLAVVLGMQALVFADGGISALGRTSSTWASSACWAPG